MKMMLRRLLKLSALFLAPAILVASLSNLAATQESGKLGSVAIAKQAAQPAEPSDVELRRLDELQAQLGVYRPWPKSVD